MSRHEFDNTDGIYEPNQDIDIEYYHDNGLISIKPNPKYIVCAKRIKNINSGTTRFYALLDGGDLYDPSAISPSYKKRNWKFKLVTDVIFNLYMKFLGFYTNSDGKQLDKHKQYIKKKAERLL